MIEESRMANRFKELDPNVQDMLSKLEPSEVETLKYLVTIPRDEFRGAVKMYRDFKAVSSFMRWLIITTLAVFVGAVSLGEQIMKLLGWMKGPPTP